MLSSLPVNNHDIKGTNPAHQCPANQRGIQEIRPTTTKPGSWGTLDANYVTSSPAKVAV